MQEKTNLTPVGQEDIAREREQAMQNIRGVAPYIDSGQVSDNAVSVRPSPTHEPAMPDEVYYHKAAMDEEMADMDDSGTEGRA